MTINIPFDELCIIIKHTLNYFNLSSYASFLEACSFVNNQLRVKSNGFIIDFIISAENQTLTLNINRIALGSIVLTPLLKSKVRSMLLSELQNYSKWFQATVNNSGDLSLSFIQPHIDIIQAQILNQNFCTIISL